MLTTSRAFGTFLIALLAACSSPPQNGQVGARQPAAVASPIDAQRLITDIRVLAHDSMEGRRTGTPGSERARRYLEAALEEIGLQRFGTSYAHTFDFTPNDASEPLRGSNLVGWVRGTAHPDHYIVITAHYDGLGIRDGAIFNGADDNASGSAALLALARHFRAQPPAHSIVFALLDAEEMGLRGARAFVSNPPLPQERIAFNVNMDMLSRNERGELYVAGTHHYPWLLPLVQRVAADAPVTLRTGHDRPDLPPGDDWTQASDHGPFHSAGIPFLYFGVEDHADYHRATDVFENIDPDFYTRAVETVRRVVRALDAEHELVTRRR